MIEMAADITLEDCTQINESVRTIFKEGEKSTNKFYDTPEDLARQERAREARLPVEENLPPRKRAEWTLGKLADVERPAGNCGEMSDLAALAAAKLKESQHKDGHIYVCKLDANKADHQFCLISTYEIPEEHAKFPGRSFGNLATLASEHPEALIVDPWLNIVSKAKDFPESAKNKFAKWQRKDKKLVRAYVTHDNEGKHEQKETTTPKKFYGLASRAAVTLKPFL